jgi:hypothetical protein
LLINFQIESISSVGDFEEERAEREADFGCE